jgi:cytochrome c553
MPTCAPERTRKLRDEGNTARFVRLFANSIQGDNAMRTALALAALLATSALPASAQVTDPALGRNLAATCAGCHNITGNAAPGMPGLAGQSKEALLRILKEYRDGKRPATLMHQLAKGYTEAQLELIAAYFAAQK